MSSELTEKILENFQIKHSFKVKESLLYEVIDQVEKDKKEIKSLEKTKDDLTSMIIHDLKNPLSHIMTINEVMLKGILGPLNDEQKEYMEDLKIETKRLLNLIMNLLDIRKQEENKFYLMKSNFSSKEFVDSFKWMERLASKQKKNLFFNYDEKIEIRADKEILARVIENLISNSLKHTHENGNIIVKISRTENSIFFEIKDSGEGISREHLSRLFEKFYRASNQQLSTKVDTGLGLAFCKLAVESHGGKVNVQSEVGKGTIFTFYIPA